MTSPREHWAAVYASKAPDSVSWYQAEPTMSLSMIERAADPPARVLDVGGGTSFLVDRLLVRGYRVGVLDVSGQALAIVQARLGSAAHDVEWVVADTTSYIPPHAWDVWHDRAVFHFLVDAHDRAAYRAALTASTIPGSAVIIATFGPAGPERCSGLPTVRYSPEQLAQELGAGFEPVETEWEVHHTPGGAVQQFVYCRFVRHGGGAGSMAGSP